MCDMCSVLKSKYVYAIWKKDGLYNVQYNNEELKKLNIEISATSSTRYIIFMHNIPILFNYSQSEIELKSLMHLFNFLESYTFQKKYFNITNDTKIMVQPNFKITNINVDLIGLIDTLKTKNSSLHSLAYDLSNDYGVLFFDYGEFKQLFNLSFTYSELVTLNALCEYIFVYQKQAFQKYLDVCCDYQNKKIKEFNGEYKWII